MERFDELVKLCPYSNLELILTKSSSQANKLIECSPQSYSPRPRYSLAGSLLQLGKTNLITQGN